ncbi:ATP-binding protein [bacterium]|nr:ATP-binding protein [bacterium]
MIGEPGAGKTTVGMKTKERLEAEGFTVAIASYSGAAKETLTAIADQLGVSTVSDDEKPKALTAAQLRESLLKAIPKPKTLLIVDDAHRWSASLRYWLEDISRAGGLLLLLASSPVPPKDIFVKIPRIELSPIKDEDIRALMKAEALSYDARLEPKELAELQQRAGNNPALAKRVIRETVLGITETTTGDHYQFIDGTPFLVALLMLVGIIRFIGLGLGDKALYVLGGVFTLAALLIRALLYAANRGSRRL